VCESAFGLAREITALTVLAEAGDLRRFSRHRQFLKFCGLDLAAEQSGQFRGVTTLSKRGNAGLRAVFCMAASVTVRMRENSFRAKFERYNGGQVIHSPETHHGVPGTKTMSRK